MSSLTHRAGVAAFLFASSAFLAAQEATLVTRSGYGTDVLQVVTISFTRFQVWRNSDSPVFFNSFQGVGQGAYRYITDGIAVLAAEIDAGLVPNGANLESVAFYVGDDEAGADRDFRGQLCRNWADLDGANPDSDCPVVVQTTGTPGDTVIAANPGIAVRYQYDVDGDSEDEVVSYFLLAQFGIGPESVYGSSIRLRHVRLLFRRQVSPAPATASFGDVPTGHLFFQFVEALAASGITAGCGSGNYCPDAPLTRGQMAVFLAKALGLHWPAL
jgi:hypothetical protein